MGPLLTAALLAILAASCTSTPPHAPYTRPGGSTPMQHSQRIVILDRNVQNALILVNSVQKRLPRGEILVEANFQNRFSDEDVWADVKFEFYDGNSVTIDETEWVQTLFPALEVTTVRGNSISTNAATHVTLMKNLYTRTGRRPIGAGKIYQLPGSSAAIPR